MLIAKVREMVSRLPDNKRIVLHNMIAMPLIIVGSTFLAGGKLTYQPVQKNQPIGFRSERFDD